MPSLKHSMPLAVAACLIALAAGPALAGNVLPASIEKRYLSMGFTVDGEEVQFSLAHLQYKNLGRMKLEKEMRIKNKLLQLVNAELKKDKAGVLALIAPVTISPNSSIFMHVFSGKGSPEEIVAVLKLAAHLKGKLGSDWKNKGDLSASVKDFYFQNIGLDCSGFAGNYARAAGAKYGPETSILAFAPAARRVKKIAQVKPGDLMVWTNNQHIATIQARRGDGKWDVIESNGDQIIFGLGNTIWEFKEVAGGKIKAFRTMPNGKKGGPAEIYVASLK